MLEQAARLHIQVLCKLMNVASLWNKLLFVVKNYFMFEGDDVAVALYRQKRRRDAQCACGLCKYTHCSNEFRCSTLTGCKVSLAILTLFLTLFLSLPIPFLFCFPTFFYSCFHSFVAFCSYTFPFIFYLTFYISRFCTSSIFSLIPSFFSFSGRPSSSGSILL